MKKHILTGILICIGFIVSAQVMLPAYQGVFSRKIIASGVAGNGLDFDGVDDYSLTNLNLDVSVVPITTWEAWVYPTANDGNYRMIMGIEDTGWDRFVAINSSNFIVGYGCGGWSPVSIDLNKWQHIAVVFNEASNVLLFYKNGVEYTKSTAGCSHSSNVKFAIGCSQQGAPGQFYQGSVDDVRIWTVARTQAEIQANMNSELLGTETGLKAYYPFNQGIAAGDNTAITTVFDKTANALNGTLTNFAKTGATSNFVVGKVVSSLISSGLVFNLDASNTASYAGSGTTWKDISNNNTGNLFGPTFSSTVNSLPNPSLYFNGNGQYVDFGASPANFPTGDISVSVWVYFSALSNASWNIFLTKWFNGTGADFHYAVKYNGTSYKQNLFTTNNSDLYGTSVISPNAWYCLGFTLKNGGDLQFYVNGVPDGKYTTVSRTNGNSIFYLGDFRSGTGICFNGYLSGANLYNRTLTSTEMLNNYNAVKGKFGL